MDKTKLKKPIQFIDLKAQYIAYKDDIDRAISRVVENTSFIQGKEVFGLEKNLAEYTGVKHCISCGSGTDALYISLYSLGIGPGDEVITTPFTFFATASVISQVGATPVFADIDSKTYNINASLVEEKITKKTKAIIPVNMFGQPADMDEINALGKKHGIVVIEDAAQSFGALYKGRQSGSLGFISCTSFFPAKPLGGYGDGGAIFTSDDEVGKKMRMIMNQGQGERYKHKYIGFNGRMDALQAAIINVKLSRYEQELRARTRIAKVYNQELHKIVTVPYIEQDRSSVYAQYSIQVANREKFLEKMEEKSIPVAVHYPIPVYRQEPYRHLNINPDAFPVTEALCKTIVSLPMSPFLTTEDQILIVEAVKQLNE